MTLPRHAKAPLAALALLPALLAAGPAARAAEPTPRDRHAAQCVAALEASAEDLARQVKAGKEASRKPLLDRLTAGAAFVGDSYLHGDSSEGQARVLVDQAEAEQRRLSAADLAARQNACAAEGTKLYNAGNALQRAVLKRLAKKRMDKLLGA